ncbi:MAG: hypothetical protein V1911_03090 [Candidatus Micrarchaeota archaeon]
MEYIKFGKIFGVGSLASLLFMGLTFAYAYSSAGNIDNTFSGVSGIADNYNINIPAIPSVFTGMLNWFFLVSEATFTNIMPNMVTGVTTMVIAQVPTQFKELAQSSVENIFADIAPATWPFYVIAVVSGLIAGIILLRTKSKWIDGAIAPIFPALWLTIIIVIVTSALPSVLSSMGGQGTAGMASLMKVSGTEYVMVFFITYLFILIGTMCAAVIWQIIEMTTGFGKEKPVQAQKTAEMRPTRGGKKTAYVEDEDDEEEEEDEEPAPKKGRKTAYVEEE